MRDTDHALARTLVATALQIPVSRISSEDHLNSIPEWDSLGQLDIVLIIEKQVGFEVDDQTFDRLITIKEIESFLEESS